VRLATVALCLLASSGWAQSRSIEGAGRITVGIGPRYVDKTWFAQHAKDAGWPMTDSLPVGPFALATFAYGATSWLEASIDLFGGYDRFTVQGLAPFDSVTYGANLALRATKLDVLFKGFSPYLGVGVGPTLVLVTSPSRTHPESAQVGTTVSAGFTLALADGLGLSLDVRWLLARGFVNDISGVNAGGIIATLGVSFLFPPEPKRDLSVPGF